MNSYTRKRQSQRAAAEERERDRQAVLELHELREICAQQVGLQLATVSLGPQFDPRSKSYRRLPDSIVGRPDPKLFGKERHGRRIVTMKGFDPRQFETSTRQDYYVVPTETY